MFAHLHHSLASLALQFPCDSMYVHSLLNPLDRRMEGGGEEVGRQLRAEGGQEGNAYPPPSPPPGMIYIQISFFYPLKISNQKGIFTEKYPKC